MFDLIEIVGLRGGRGGRVTPRSTGRSRSARPRRSGGSGFDIGRIIRRGIFYYFGWRIGHALANALGFFGIVLIIIFVIWLSRRRRR